MKKIKDVLVTIFKLIKYIIKHRDEILEIKAKIEMLTDQLEEVELVATDMIEQLKDDIAEKDVKIAELELQIGVFKYLREEGE